MQGPVILRAVSSKPTSPTKYLHSHRTVAYPTSSTGNVSPCPALVLGKENLQVSFGTYVTPSISRGSEGDNRRIRSDVDDDASRA